MILRGCTNLPGATLPSKATNIFSVKRLLPSALCHLSPVGFLPLFERLHQFSSRLGSINGEQKLQELLNQIIRRNHSNS